MIEIYRKQSNRVVLDQVIGNAVTSQTPARASSHEQDLTRDFRPHRSSIRKTGKTERERKRAEDRLLADKRRQTAFQQSCEREIWPFGRDHATSSAASNVRQLHAFDRASHVDYEKITDDLVNETADFISRERSRLRARLHLVKNRGLNVAEATRIENLAWERACSRRKRA